MADAGSGLCDVIPKLGPPRSSQCTQLISIAPFALFPIVPFVFPIAPFAFPIDGRSNIEAANNASVNAFYSKRPSRSPTTRSHAICPSSHSLLGNLDYKPPGHCFPSGAWDPRRRLFRSLCNMYCICSMDPVSVPSSDGLTTTLSPIANLQLAILGCPPPTHRWICSFDQTPRRAIDSLSHAAAMAFRRAP